MRDTRGMRIRVCKRNLWRSYSAIQLGWQRVVWQNGGQMGVVTACLRVVTRLGCDHLVTTSIWLNAKRGGAGRADGESRMAGTVAVGEALPNAGL